MSLLRSIIASRHRGGGGATDPYFANVSLLLHCDGADASTTFTDSGPIGHTVTAVGNAQIDTANKQWGTGAALFDGTGDYLSIPHHSSLEIETGDFTIEMWVYIDAANTTRYILSTRDAGGFYLRAQSGGLLRFVMQGVSTIDSATGALPEDVWCYLAVTRSGNTLKIFVDGVEVASGTVGNGTAGTAALTIGAVLPAANYWLGAMDEIRITKGVARDVSVIPTAAFPDS